MHDYIKNNEQAEQLLNLFFCDSTYAKLIVDAKTQNIILVNEPLLELIQQSDKSLIGQSWMSIDSKDNHQKYNTYIKEINSNEQVKFTIKHKIANKVQILEVEYYMGILDGEIVYVGTVMPEDAQEISVSIYEVLTDIYQTEIQDLSFPSHLDKIRHLLGFSFLSFVELSDDKYLSSISSGEKMVVKNVIESSFDCILNLLKDNNGIEIDSVNDQAHNNYDLLKKYQLHSICIYPIVYQNTIFGTLIAGGKQRIDNWHTISIVLKTLANKCKFNLFQKTIVDQREIEGRIDKLTGLPNRNSMTNKFAGIINEGISSDKYLSLMIIDIHKVNYYNKKLGTELTDEIIKNVSKLILKSIGTNGQAYRLSGDEFMVLLHPHSEKTLVEVEVKKIMKKLQRPFLLSNAEDIEVNFNIGISIFPDDGQTVASMMKNADLALYDAKLAGRNNFIIFKYSETGQALKQKTEMEENLKVALEKEHIKVYFQPKIHAATENIVGFEALVRWIDPEIGMINPGHFIPLAEETGIINKIGEYVTKQSCELLMGWQKKFGLNLTCSINLSVVQLMDNNLPSKLEEIINASGIHPHNIDFEITETISLTLVPNLVEILNEIVEIGCTLSIDDFGTGHSSLDYVKKIPAKHIKIDQSFVANIGLNPEDEAILDATINIAKRLKRKIIAEGVETEGQREYLIDRECDYFQGFLFARPKPAEDIEKLLTQRVALMGVH